MVFIFSFWASLCLLRIEIIVMARSRNNYTGQAVKPTHLSELLVRANPTSRAARFDD